jgi:hypothetical protein
MSTLEEFNPGTLTLAPVSDGQATSAVPNPSISPYTVSIIGSEPVTLASVPRSAAPKPGPDVIIPDVIIIDVPDSEPRPFAPASFGLSSRDVVTLAAVGSLNFSSPFGFEQGRSSILFDGGGSFGGFIDAGARDAAGPVRIESANGGLSVDAVLNVVGALALLTLDQASSIHVTGPVSVDEGGTLAAIGIVDVAGPVDIADGTVDVSQSTGGLDQGVRFDGAAGHVVLHASSRLTAVDFRAGDTITVAGVDAGLPFQQAAGSSTTWLLGSTVEITFAGDTAPGTTYTAAPDGNGNTVITTSAEPAAPVAFSDETTGVSGSHGLSAAGGGGPGYLRWSYLEASDDEVALATTVPDVVIGGAGSGTKALQVTSGHNVLIGGTGSAFMVGGSGDDTFFADLRGAQPFWDTLVDFNPGDSLTVWGWTAGDGLRVDVSGGADGATGATLRILDAGGAIKGNVTFMDWAVNQVVGLLRSTGVQPAGSYLSLTNVGVYPVYPSESATITV